MPDDGLRFEQAISTRTQKQSQPLYASRIVAALLIVTGIVLIRLH